MEVVGFPNLTTSLLKCTFSQPARPPIFSLGSGPSLTNGGQTLPSPHTKKNSLAPPNHPWMGCGSTGYLENMPTRGVLALGAVAQRPAG
jgi:hypothetical protein